MNEQQFKNKMNYARGMKETSEDDNYWSGYIRGLRRYYHGEKFGTQEEHEKYLSLIRDSDESRNSLGQGYSDALNECQRSDAAATLGRKGGSATSEAKKKSSADNLAKARSEGKKGGRPRSDNPVRKRPYHKKEE